MTGPTGRTRPGRGGSTRARGAETGTGEREDVAPDAVLELLGDEYTRTVLEAVLDDHLSGADVAEETGVSRPTAFRRLNELVDLGLVETRQQVDPEGGHHHKQYRAVVDSVSVTFEPDGFEAVVETDTPAGPRPRAPARVPAND